ncbi:hypothetical protein A2U01_0078412, partial [Trifolium medium]|nr:hypothetical protein [Trifolium medium]
MFVTMKNDKERNWLDYVRKIKDVVGINKIELLGDREEPRKDLRL